MADDNKEVSYAEEDGSGHVRRLHSSHGSGMDSSVFRFKNVNFVVGKKDAPRNLLTDVSGTIKWGRT